MNLSKSAENTLLVYANACEYYAKNYHYRSLQQTLDVKGKVYLIKRSLSTINRENRKFRDENFISKWKRTTGGKGTGRRFTSSITHLTWKGIYYLVKRKLLPWNFIRIWEKISKKDRPHKIMKKKGKADIKEPEICTKVSDKIKELVAKSMKSLPEIIER